MKFEIGPDDAGSRLDHFLAGRLNGWTRSRLQSLNRRGAVLVDGRREKDGHRLHTGNAVQIDLPDHTASPDLVVHPEAIPLDVHYEDEAFAVVEKPAGMVVHPGAGVSSGTLAHALMARFGALSSAAGRGRPGIVHRLDRWTSGLILVARTNAAHAALSSSFQRREVEKTYRAGVHGQIRNDTGAIDLSIGRHPTRRTRMTAGSQSGRQALSEFSVRDRAGGFSLLDVHIHTGRTHQIRVHLAAIGHPVIGDNVYGEKLDRAFARRHGSLGRYFLHAAILAFPHPVSGERVRFESPVPGELSRLWAQLSGVGS
jgi:23S rRNA pseudouridine1911/1915/1917 synthase